MSGPLRTRRPTSGRRPRPTVVREAVRSSPLKPVPERILQLQRQAGNQAVVQLLQRQARTPRADATGTSGTRGTVQRKAGSHRENPDLTTLHPSGTLDEAGWTTAFKAARAQPSLAAYEPLFRDAALTAGMDGLGPGFVPPTLPTTDGATAKPGLNITLDTSGEPGHTAWVDTSGTFGVPTPRGAKAPLDVSVAIILTPQALAADKGLALRTARHEMVHARHKLKVLAALRAWRALPARGRPDFSTWLTSQSTRRKDPMSTLDVALVGRGAQDASAGTEVLGYVEGFMTDYHRRVATLAQAGPAFAELLGAVETSKLYTWAQADPAVRDEALTRLREYRATLDADHQRLWKEWLDAQLPRAAKDRTGRKEFLTALTAFVT